MYVMNMLKEKRSRLMAVGAAFVAAVVLASCGGKGAGGNGSGVSALKAAAMSLITSEPSLGSDGQTTALLTAIVKNENNASLENEPVEWSTTDPGAILQINENNTDANGRATASLSISDTTVRTVQVTAASGAVSQTISIPVVGTVISISGSSTIVFNSPTQFSLSLRDSAGGPITGAPVSVTSANGNLISPAVIATDSLGQATFNVTGQVAGTDTITASAQGVSETYTASVSSTQMIFTPATVVDDILVNTGHRIEVTLQQNGAAVPNAQLSFNATRGTLRTSLNGPLLTGPVLTGANGSVDVFIDSPSAGISTLTATALADGTTATTQVEFISDNPTNITLQASPTVVGANIDPSGTKSSQIIAVVRDPADNPVKGIRVDFSSITDPSNGRIEPGFGQTDSFGVATASFIAGANATGPDGVEIQGQVTTQSGGTLTATTKLTVAALQLAVQMGTGNEISDTDTSYTMPWVAVVSDSAGNPVENALVTVSVKPLFFRKGHWIPNPLGAGWAAEPTLVCPSEDANENGRLDWDPAADDTDGDGQFSPGEGEDLNGDGRLTPGGPAVASVVGSGRTDATGLANIEVTYPQDEAVWSRVELQVNMTTTAGTQGTATEEFWLPVLGDDVSSLNQAPPGARSPHSKYGLGPAIIAPLTTPLVSDCMDTN